ncbi:alpha-glucan water dikinase, chloroplastic-like isoform X1 [Ipomoea triloba]|uniref:alpha-glucan water dikinase, chloroplastic-like isoform X1 n=2 Tax=Ipomoea triloba TaxID=35885 RepID=UPI00125D0EE0|nr:alpha-glucan water dikinase, chloroplastic-like isoform X1 [Ipomoea triloba]XP_031122010.1 alpha-glucan water dikinase, chloroplastic-like isoform X1 [Ipomoea triloba]XP_031122011.1 alpha-glucan water dikinase, chloroplastic-like isoform X1 [Ipomoea triloba]
MSNSLWSNLLHQRFLPSSLLEYRSRIGSPSYLGGSSLFQSQVNSQKRKPPFLTELCTDRFALQKKKFPMAHKPSVSGSIQAKLATNPSSEQIGEKFNLEGNMELQVDVKPPTSGHVLVDFKVTSSSKGLFLHWGAIKSGKDRWVLPHHRPNGTIVYKNRALRTPLVQSGSYAVLRLDIDDPAIQAIEFVIYHEPQNKWIKNSDNNFHVKIPPREPQRPLRLPRSNVSVTEDLVQMQAYLRWERKGKQTYNPQQEKEEYEAARTELLEEITRGTSIVDIRARLMKKNDKVELKEQAPAKTKGTLPIELVQTQAYIRWEKAGKPFYSSVEQNKEFEEAKKELQLELEKGISLEELRKKVVKGEIQTKVAKKQEKRHYSSMEKIQRKKRDVAQLINKDASGEQILGAAQVLSRIERFSKSKEGQVDGPIITKKIYKIGNSELMVLVAKPSGKTKVYLATDLNEPVILHWALSRKPGEWLAPPANVLPYGSVSSHHYAETQFSSCVSDNLSDRIQSLEIGIGDGDFTGMPFVLLSGRNWIKDRGSDFYVDFSTQPKQDGEGTAKALLDKIANMESEAQKSFMHRFNIAADLVTEATNAGELGFAAILVWMRFMATRQLIWNKNYNVKPREISRSQDRLTDMLQDVYISCPQYRGLLHMIMSTVGRGGEGDVGQRIRDEILVIQRKNDCKGGMMEEWHQKLHNNTSPDDIVICQALIDYLNSDFDISIYWKTLNSNGITKERLLSYDRAIHSEPNFRRNQKEGLLHDLGSYMRTLKAVHSGADLESAIGNCMGYKAEGEGFMVGVHINPVSGLPSGFRELLQFILNHVEDNNVEALLEGLLEAREELRPLLSGPNNRLKDLLFLDIALDSTVRTAVERGYEELNASNPEKIIYFISLVLENLALSVDDNEDFVYCLKGWNQALSMSKSGNNSWALFAKSVLDRTRLALASKAEWYHHLLQPSAEYLGSKLGVDQWAVSIFTEEIIRAGSAASLSSLINRLDPVLRQTAQLGSWQIISPVEAVGYIVVVDDLLSVQNKSYDKPTILVAKNVKGEEEIPDGTTAVLTPDMPDVLSHVSVRARNGKVCFATCFDPNILAELQAKEGRVLSLKPTSADIVYSEVKDDDILRSIDITDGDSSQSLTLVKKHFAGRYAIVSQEFTSELVGAKSRNIASLKGKVPSWIGIPTSVAIPFGVFEQVLSDTTNQGVATKLQVLKKRLSEGEFSILGEIRKTVLELSAPSQLVKELKDKMKSSGMPWPGDESPKRWEQAWMAIKKVWASKWNERAYFSTRKVKLDHDYLCMAVLVQEIINADYAFVIHTTNPSTGDSSEIYAEVVKGLGETLVGAYPGRAMSFACKKNDLSSPQVLGYPSKPTGLFIRPSIIFRSDSNGEDLEGYAGAGLYDSVAIDEAEKVVLDYSCDPLITDSNFRQSILSGIVSAGRVIEELNGSPQDIEGVVKDSKIYVVQTRPQM